MAGIGLNPSGCCCSEGCGHKHKFLGCGSEPAPDVVVKLWDSAAKAVKYDEGTTDSTGSVELTAPSGAYLEASHPSGRFATFTATSSCSPEVQSHNLTAASGYTCVLPLGAPCFLPVPTTLHFSSAYWGTATLAFNATTSVWQGTGTFSYPGGCKNPGPPCPAVDAPFTITISGSVALTYKTELYTVFLQGSSTCPTAGAGTGNATALSSGTTTVCTPYSLSGNLTGDASVCYHVATFTITE